MRNFPGTRFGAEIWSRTILICLGVLALILLVQALRHWALTLRSSAIGIFVRVLPAAGASISNLIAYDQAKKNSKTPERFGKGSEEGIIASESANNATMGGALMVLVALGIPGDAAAVLAALLVHDVAPSPTFMSESPDIVYVILLAFVIGHVFVLLLQTVALRIFVRVVGIPIYVLAGAILLYTGMGSLRSTTPCLTSGRCSCSASWAI